MPPAALPGVDAEPWAFWAPSDERFIDAALNLADVGAGDRFVDLGCGDGRVLVAAARRGASVRGIELDERRAATARGALEAAGVAGVVDCDDMFGATIEADVVYAYLTPATLTRLVPQLVLRKGTRIVAPRYPLTGWAQISAADSCFLYRAPLVRETGPGWEGWRFRGLVAVLPADRRCLLPLVFGAKPGDLDLELGPTLRRVCHGGLGADTADSSMAVPVDLQFERCAAGSSAAGPIRVQCREITLAVVFAAAGHGQWTFGPGEGQAFQEKLAASRTAAQGAPP